MNQELMYVLNELNQQHEMLQEQFTIVEQQLRELQQFSDELELLEHKSESAILAPLGKGVFAPVQFSSSTMLFLEVGAGYFVKKPVAATKSVVREQLKRMYEFKTQLNSQLQDLTGKLEQLLMTTQRA